MPIPVYQKGGLVVANSIMHLLLMEKGWEITKIYKHFPQCLILRMEPPRGWPLQS